MKKAQVTIFIIVGVVILLILGLLLTMNFSSPEEKPVEASSLQPYVSQCLSENLKESVHAVGLQGGYLTPPEGSVLIEEPFSVPYFYNGKKAIPRLSFIEKEIAEYVNYMMPLCKLSVFEEQGFNVNTGEMSVDVKIANNDITAELNYPITLEKGNTTVREESFSAKFESRLWQYYHDANNITLIIAQKKAVPLSDIVLLGSEHGYKTDIIHENDSVIFRFYDNKSIPASYNFAAKYNITTEETKELEIPPQYATVGYEYTYDFENDNLTAHTDMFEIKNAQINFTPRYEDRGEHLIMIEGDAWTYMNLTISAENNPPEIEPISDRSLQVGKDFTYQVNCHDDNTIFYNSETDLEGFELGLESGQISFTPKASQVGKHNITIVVVDESGQKDNETFQVEIYE